MSYSLRTTNSFCNLQKEGESIPSLFHSIRIAGVNYCKHTLLFINLCFTLFLFKNNICVMTHIGTLTKAGAINSAQKLFKTSLIWVLSFSILVLSACNTRGNNPVPASTSTSQITQPTLTVETTTVMSTSTTVAIQTQTVNLTTIMPTTSSLSPIPAEYQTVYSSLKSTIESFYIYLNTKVPSENEPIFGA